MTTLPDPAHLDLRPLPGSERAPAAGLVGAASAPVPSDERVEVTLVLRRRASAAGSGPDPTQGTLTAAELADRFGADPTDVDLVRRTLGDLGVDILDVDLTGRRVRAAGSAALLSRVFGTDLQQMSSTGPAGEPVSHRHRTGGLSVPGALDGVVTAVLGLDDRPQSRAHFRLTPAAAGSTSYTPVQLGAIYDFPDGLDGAGQSVAIIELGGGFEQSDLDTYFQGLGLSGVSVRAVGVDGATNVPGQDPQGADGEVMLDIEVVGALVPKADVVVYFAPNTDAGFLDAVTSAAQASPAPVAMSISWGQSEDQWTAQARTAMDGALADAAALGVTVTAASGDNGSADGESGGAHVDFPSSSPHVLACGGTSLRADPTSGAVQSETVWNDGSSGGATGGGVSDAFPLPDWQQDAGVPTKDGSTGRGVPDVAGDADPQTGYQVRIDGSDLVIGGTSAVAPLWAALVARLAQSAGRPLGLLQPVLYGGTTGSGSVAAGFRDITSGDNGDYSAAAGWDACTGLGVPQGQALLDRFPPAG
jgi:kumamolisin